MHNNDASRTRLSPAAHWPPLAATRPGIDEDAEPFLGPRVVVHLGEPPQVGLQWARREPLTHVRRLHGSALMTLLAEVLDYLDRHPYVRPADCAIRGLPRADEERRQALTLPVAALRELVALERRD